MIIPAVLVFVLTFGVFTGALAFVSLGTVDTWFLILCPALVSAVMAVGTLLVGHKEDEPLRPETKIARKLHSYTMRIELTLGLFLPIAMIGLLVTLALPVSRHAENLTVIGVVAVSLIGAGALAKREMIQDDASLDEVK